MSIIPAKESDWLNRANYTAKERRNICGQLMSEAQYWDSAQYLKMMHDSTKRPWVDLTDEEIALIDWESLATKKDCLRAIEAKLKEKNNAT